MEISNLNGEVGKIISVNSDGFVIGAVGNGILIKKIQIAGKKPVDGVSYLNGKRIGIGDRVSL